MKYAYFIAIALFSLNVQSQNWVDGLNQINDGLTQYNNQTAPADYKKLLNAANEYSKGRLIAYSDLNFYKENEGYLFGYYKPAKTVFMFWMGDDGKLKRNIVIIDEKCKECKEKMKTGIYYNAWKESLPLEQMFFSQHLNNYTRSLVFHPDLITPPVQPTTQTKPVEIKN